MTNRFKGVYEHFPFSSSAAPQEERRSAPAYRAHQQIDSGGEHFIAYTRFIIIEVRANPEEKPVNGKT